MFIYGRIAEKGSVSFDELYKLAFKHLPEETGSLISFTGTVRSVTRSSPKKVTGLFVEAWMEKGDEVMEGIARRVAEKYGLQLAILVHLTGELRVGEPIVHVIVGSTHRQEGFQAIEEIIHAYKTESPVWKKEIYDDGTQQWITTKHP